MKSLDIINQLKIMLPNYTDYFHNQVSISNITVVNSLATFITTDTHDFETGDAVIISDYVLRNTISGVSSVGGSTTDWLVTTEIDHDQTKASFETKTVTLGGFTDDDWNGELTLIQAGRNNLIIRFDEGVSSPTLTGDEYLEEKRIDGFNGQHTVTVLSQSSFSLDTTVKDGTYGGGSISLSIVRVGAAYDIDQAIDLYTAQNTDDYWAFIIMGNPKASRDTSTITEAVNDLMVGSYTRISVIDGFEVVVFIPTSDDKEAGRAIDIARFELLPILHKCLLGVSFDCGLSSNNLFRTGFVEAYSALYNKSFLCYSYVYEFQYLITEDDCVEPSLSRAWRDFDYTSYTNYDKLYTSMSGIYYNQDNIE